MLWSCLDNDFDNKVSLSLSTTYIVSRLLVPDFQVVRNNAFKHSTICKYNAAKSFVDLSDQMISYASPLRKKIKWYHKLAIDLLTNTTMLNAFLYHRNVTKSNISLKKFREEVVQGILSSTSAGSIPIENDFSGNGTSNITHKLDIENIRKRCERCYQRL